MVPGGGARIHHSFEDPAAAPTASQLAKFREVRDQIADWMSDFVRNQNG